MTTDDLCRHIQDGLSSQYDCTVTKRGAVRVQTPMLLPDGDGIDVFVIERDGRIVVSDFGDALGWLETQSRTGRLSDGQEQMMQDVLDTIGVRLEQGRLSLHCDHPHELADAVAKVGQAALRVADIWFTFRNQAFRSTAEEVDEWLRRQEIPFRPRERVPGRSSRKWTIDFATIAPLPPSYVFLLSAWDRGTSNRLVDHVVAACADLSRAGPPDASPQLVSLFDDEAGIWDEVHYRQLEPFAALARWSDRLSFEELLRSPLPTA